MAYYSVIVVERTGKNEFSMVPVSNEEGEQLFFKNLDSAKDEAKYQVEQFIPRNYTAKLLDEENKTSVHNYKMIHGEYIVATYYNSYCPIQALVLEHKMKFVE